jgi:uncharacterized membrane protein
MASTPSPESQDRIRAGALLLASGLQIAESLVPRVPLFPWLRLGLSWAVILPFLSAFGTLPAVGLFLSRNILAVAFGGQPPTTFLISSASGAAAILLLGGPIRTGLARGWIGWIGAGILQATAFNMLQLFLVTWLLVGHGGYLFQMGPILAWSIVSGAVVAWMASRWFPPEAWVKLTASCPQAAQVGIVPTAWRLEAVLWTAVCLAPAFLDGAEPVLSILGGCAVFAMVGKRFGDLELLLQAWPYFFFLAWFHLLDTPGHLMGFGGVTREGMNSFLVHAGRLGVFLLAGRNLFRILPWNSFLSKSPWARAVSIALPLLPGLFQASTAAARESWNSRRDPGSPSYPERLLSRLGEG